MVGLDNIPETGPALIVFYHGAIPIDFYYVLSKCILFKGRLIRCVGDRFLFKIPGTLTLTNSINLTHTSTNRLCVIKIQDGRY